MNPDNPSLVLDPDEVIFDADGNVESMTDPDTGEKVTSDPRPAAPRDPDGPYDGIDGEGEEAGEKAGNLTSGRAQSAESALDPVLADTLAVYGLLDEDGQITDTIEWNGEQTRVRDLSAEDRREFLSELRERDREQASGLSAEQRELIDFLNAGGNLREALGVAPAAEGLTSALSADELNRFDIREQYPSLSDEEVEEELEDRKAGKRYENKTGQLRERLGAAEQASALAAEQAEFVREQQLFVSSAEQLTDILGFPVEAEVRQFLLAQTATQQDNGQSPFLNGLTPEKMLRLQFLDTFADQIDQHYKAEVAAAHKRGRAEALNGAPTSPGGRSGSAGNAGPGARAADTRKYLDYTLGE